MHILFAVGRVLLVVIFILSGIMKLLDLPGTAAMIAPVVAVPDVLADHAGRLEEVVGMPVPQILALLAGVVEVVAGLLVAFNIATRSAAAVLALFTVVATYYFHAFWSMSGEMMQNNMIHALKNLAIIGGLLIMVVLGNWRPLRSRM
jgi:uncharacterized membrane protein YphA (DoxX/SURF4 family)